MAANPFMSQQSNQFGGKFKNLKIQKVNSYLATTPTQPNNQFGGFMSTPNSMMSTPMSSQFGAMPSQPAQQMFGGQQSNMSTMGQLGGAFGQMGLGGGSVPPSQAPQQQSNPFADLGSFEKKPQQQQATAAPTSNIDLFG